MENEEGLKSSFDYQPIDLNDPGIRSQVEEIEDAILDTQDVMVLWVDKPKITIGAKKEDGLVGVAQVSESGHVNYFVHPEHQGRGVATSLLKRIMKESKDSGIPELVATVNLGSASEAVLKKMGFSSSETEGEKAFYKRKLDDI